VTTEQKVLAYGVAAGTITGVAIGLMIALALVMKTDVCGTFVG
jgi:tetrahydromethanopterin S-methyltransferase F subunit